MNKEKLAAIIEYAGTRVPYYKNMFSEKEVDIYHAVEDGSFDRIPVLSKDKVLKDIKCFLSDEFEQQDLDVSRTSGSTGKILEVYWQKGDMIRSLLSLWTERRILHNIQPTSKCCYFHSIAYRESSLAGGREVFSPKVMIRDKGIVLSLSKLHFNDGILNVYCQKIKEFGPEWIMCHPSTLRVLSEYIKREGKNPFEKLRYIELTGEYLTEACREEISSFFQVPMANHYGAQEVNGIAYECPNGHLHCLGNNVYVEITDGERNIGYGRKGFVCVTGLNNRYMPFIRYNLGDMAIMRDGTECGCGNKNPYLEICAGRGNEIIEMKPGKKIECVVFFYIVEWINALMRNLIIQFQVMRKAEEWFVVKMVLASSGDEERKKIRELFSLKACDYGFGSAIWEFEFADVILPEQNIGKLNFYYDMRRNR